MTSKLSNSQIARLLLIIEKERASKLALEIEITNEEAKLMMEEDKLEKVDGELNNIVKAALRPMNQEELKLVLNKFKLKKIIEGSSILLGAIVISTAVPYIAYGTFYNAPILIASAISAIAFTGKYIVDRHNLNKTQYKVLVAGVYDEVMEQIGVKEEEKRNILNNIRDLDKNLELLDIKREYLNSRIDKLYQIKNQYIYLYGQEGLIKVDPVVQVEIETLMEESYTRVRKENN